MNTKDEVQDTPQSSAYNAFPEPQTIPAGWDTSVFLSAPPSVPEPPAEASTKNDSE